MSKLFSKKVSPLRRTGLGWMCKLKSSLPHIWNCLLIHTYWTSSFLKNLCLAGDSEVLKKMFITVGVDISDQHGLSSEHHTYWGRFDTINNSSIMYTALRYTWYNWNNISKYPLSLISVGKNTASCHLLMSWVVQGVGGIVTHACSGCLTHTEGEGTL